MYYVFVYRTHPIVHVPDGTLFAASPSNPLCNTYMLAQLMSGIGMLIRACTEPIGGVIQSGNNINPTHSCSLQL